MLSLYLLCIVIKANNKIWEILFKQMPHPLEVSDFWHTYNLPNITNVLYWFEFFEKTKYLDGSILEFGVGRGRSLISIMSLEYYYRTKKNYRPKKIYAFDSFQGFPEPSAEDKSKRNPKKGEWSHSPNGNFKYSKANLKKILRNAGFPKTFIEEINIVKGFFSKTTKNTDIKKIAIMHLDGDLYHSVKDPLDNLSNKIIKGGLVVVDDFILNKKIVKEDFWPGARKAVEDFMKVNKKFRVKESISGNPYLTKLQ